MFLKTASFSNIVSIFSSFFLFFFIRNNNLTQEQRRLLFLSPRIRGSRVAKNIIQRMGQLFLHLPLELFEDSLREANKNRGYKEREKEMNRTFSTTKSG